MRDTSKTILTFFVIFFVTLSFGIAAGCDRPPEAEHDGPATYAVALQVSTPSALPKCVSSLGGTTAYVAQPAGLWSCIGGAWVPLPCASILAGAVAYASATKTLWACTSGQWTQIMTAGAPGPQGTPGSQGAPGPAGATPLVRLTPEPPGARCAGGGQRFDVGIDVNLDGALGPEEIQQTAYVCNGTSASGGRCGDGIIQLAANEECDTGGASRTCDPDCTSSLCGDLFVNALAGEQCEPPGTASCSASCAIIVDDVNGPGAFGALSGALGTIGAEQLESLESSAVRNTLEFGQEPFSVNALSPEGRFIYSQESPGGSAGISEALSFEVLRRSEHARFLKMGREVAYDASPGGGGTDLLVEIAGLKVGVTVTRAASFPPGLPYDAASASGLIGNALRKMQADDASVSSADRWRKQILHVLSQSPAHAEAIMGAFYATAPAARASTMLLVTVTEGNDVFVYDQ